VNHRNRIPICHGQTKLTVHPDRIKKKLPERVGPEIKIPLDYGLAWNYTTKQVIWSSKLTPRKPFEKPVVWWTLNPIKEPELHFQIEMHVRFPTTPVDSSDAPLTSVTLSRGNVIDIDLYSPILTLRDVEKLVGVLRSDEKLRSRGLMLWLVAGVRPSKEEVERWTREAALRKAAESRAKATLAAASNRRKARKRGRRG